LDAGPDPLYNNNHKDELPLHAAARNDCLEMVSLRTVGPQQRQHLWEDSALMRESFHRSGPSSRSEWWSCYASRERRSCCSTDSRRGSRRRSSPSDSISLRERWCPYTLCHGRQRLTATALVLLIRFRINSKSHSGDWPFLTAASAGSSSSLSVVYHLLRSQPGVVATAIPENESVPW